MFNYEESKIRSYKEFEEDKVDETTKKIYKSQKFIYNFVKHRISDMHPAMKKHFEDVGGFLDGYEAGIIKHWRSYMLVILLIFGIAGLCFGFEGVVIHHSATESGTVESIRRYHIEERGWSDIGYHYLITRDGKLHEGRPLSKQGAHAKGRNRTHIGICLIGNDDFTEAQKSTLKITCKSLKKLYFIKKIERHHKACPGPGLNIEELKDEILAKTK